MLSKNLLLDIKKSIEDYLELNEGHLGLCSFIDSNGLFGLIVSGRQILRHYSRSWPKFSGCDIYPVPDPRTLKSEESARVKDLKAMNIYDRTPHWEYLKGEYGELRKEYCLHLISCIDKELLELNKG